MRSRSSPSATPEGSEAVSEDSSSTRSKKHKHKSKNKVIVMFNISAICFSYSRFSLIQNWIN